MAMVPWAPMRLAPGQAAAPLTVEGTPGNARVTELPVPAPAPPPGGMLDPVRFRVALPSALTGAALAALAPVSVPGAWTPDPLGPVSPGARVVKGQTELSGAGGSEPGALGIAPDAGLGSWSDNRMPFRRQHFIPYPIPGMQSAYLGALGPGGEGQLPEAKRHWFGLPAGKPDMGDAMRGQRYPTQMVHPTQQASLAQEMGGPYSALSGGVLPPAGTDPYGSLPDFLRAPLVGGPAGMSGTPGT